MTEAHRRKKAPQQVRRALLDCAAQMVVHVGLAGLSLRAVAAAAGVTKGGLLHHFPDRQAFVAAVGTDLLQSLDGLIDHYIAEYGPDCYGAFTRAYVMAALIPVAPTPWASLSMTLLTDPGLRTLWSGWLHTRLRNHADTDRDPALAVVRYAVDGVWLTALTGDDSTPPLNQGELCSRLLALIETRI